MRHVVIVAVILLTACTTEGGNPVDALSESGVDVPVVEDADDDVETICGYIPCSCECLNGQLKQWQMVDLCGRPGEDVFYCEQECLSHCPPVDLPVCSTLTYPNIAGCVALDGQMGDYENGMQDILVSGVVESVGDGRLGISCLDGPHEVGWSGEEMTGYWFRIRDDGGDLWSPHVVLPGSSRPQIGDAVTLEVMHHQYPFSPSRGSFYLISGSRRLLWIGQDGSVSSMQPPGGIELQAGRAACTGTDQCGSWAGYDVSAGRGVEGSSIPYGQTGRLGDATIVHGSVLHQTTSLTTCLDWFKAYAVVGIYWDEPAPINPTE